MIIKLHKRKKAQTAVEYALLISAVIVAIVAVRGLAQRATQGRIKEASKEVGHQFDESNFYHGYTTAGRTGEDTYTIETLMEDGVRTTDTQRGQTMEQSESTSWGDEAN